MIYPPLGDYALIGDFRGAGRISRDVSLDWLCYPRVGRPSIFAAVLDVEVGGRFRIRPTGQFNAMRRYERTEERQGCDGVRARGRSGDSLRPPRRHWVPSTTQARSKRGPSTT